MAVKVRVSFGGGATQTFKTTAAAKKAIERRIASGKKKPGKMSIRITDR